MKWINLSERQPADLKKVVFRRVMEKNVFKNPGKYKYEYYPDIKQIWFGSKKGSGMVPMELFEWLDEFDDSGWYHSQDKVDRLLAEQHRNTRHDAAEAVMGYIAGTDCFLGASSAHSLIMNLKQRKP